MWNFRVHLRVSNSGIHWETACNATNNPTFANQFGGNVYKVVIPPGSKYKRFNHNQWLLTGFAMVNRAAKKACKMVNHPWPKDEFHWRYQAFRQLESTSPYEGLYEVSHLVLQYFGEDVYQKFCEILPKQSDIKPIKENGTDS